MEKYGCDYQNHQITKLSTSGAARRYRVAYPESPAFLEHHFPNAPLYPLFIQMQWILQIAREEKLLSPSYELNAIRCKKPIVPQNEIYVTITCSDGTARFSIETEEHQCTTGSINTGDLANNA